ncbi:MAG TPA: hypothetical protein VLT32_08180 [Candidatus Sulfomarinibacteraceae bacterium]|nr:hypothetical protein [Candidatus Sulfomarinibacteraceae bacterium]
MDPSELLERLAQTLETLRIPYLITGSMATIAYGEPRFTNDIDVVVRLAPHQIDELCRAFPADEFYISRDAVADAVARHTQFNVLHPTSGLKIDVMVADDSEFNQARFSRARSLRVAVDRDVIFASPEDVIIKKLVFYRDGGSEKHLRDISGMLKIMGAEIDRAYIERWVQRLGLSREWSSFTRE